MRIDDKDAAHCDEKKRRAAGVGTDEASEGDPILDMLMIFRDALLFFLECCPGATAEDCCGFWRNRSTDGGGKEGRGERMMRRWGLERVLVV